MKIQIGISGILFLSVLLLDNCRLSQNRNHEAGRQLVQRYCGSCHLPVFPETLDSITWIDHVLPAMAPKLGIHVWGKNQYYRNPRDSGHSAISYEEWMKLIAYYKDAAPQSIHATKAREPLRNDNAVFKVNMPVWTDTSRKAATTLVSIDTVHHTIYSGDASTNELSRWGRRLNPVLIRHLPSPPVHLTISRDSGKSLGGILTCIGIIKAIDVANGQVVTTDLNKERDSGKIIISNLPRPTQAVSGDFNKDGLADQVVCAFGHNNGGLYLFQQEPGGGFKKISIRNIPGAEQAVVQDFNHDGWPDIMALFAQGDEGIWLFLNDRKGGFASVNLLRFPPVYGSTSFQLVDFNHDGRLDILYTCGDNADYSQILKPFHGVYIFLNQGNFRYKQAYFYPVNGCTKAIAVDFDGDGDLDITAIAFFADFKNNPSESFIYFEQEKPWHFIPHALPIHQYGRWICMDAGDYDGDGDPDIVLGNYATGFIVRNKYKSGWDQYLPLLVLENKSVE